MNVFGGSWTEQKIQLVENYAKAYLTIMNKYPGFKLMYFDGFAGSGEIEMKKQKGKPDTELELEFLDTDIKSVKGAAKRVVAIKQPKPFDMYYFVELDKKKAASLKTALKGQTNSKIYIVSEDCNVKLKKLASFLKGKTGKKYKVLAFIDPFGMNVEWEAIEQLKGLSVDMWILVPTGLGVNRLLKKNRDIPAEWIKSLESFFGISSDELIPSFYSDTQSQNLFGEDVTTVTKKTESVKKIHSIYSARMETIFKYVSKSYVLKNSSNSIMFHFFLASNNSTAVKIANEMIKKLSNNN